jgi:3'(2'), 5'-bisphosphate nucleotidase
MNDHELALEIATRAGEIVMQIRKEANIDTSDNDAAKQLAVKADLTSNDYLLAQLAAHRPLDAVLSEESADSDERLTADRVWIIDPVDGTYEYARSLPECAIHVALWSSSENKLIAGAVVLPEHNFAWTTTEVKSVEIREAAARPFVIIASPRESKDLLAHLTQGLIPKVEALGYTGVEIDNCGSVGGKVDRVLTGRADLYVSSAGFNEWDSAAPTVIGLHQGLAVTDMEGRDLVFNQKPPKTASYVATWPHHQAMVLSVLKNR